MHRTFLSLAVAALAGFATAVHADDGAAARSTVVAPHAGPSQLADLLRPRQGEMKVATVHGDAEAGKPCHAKTSNGDEIENGTYVVERGEVICEGKGFIWCSFASCFEGTK